MRNELPRRNVVLEKSFAFAVGIAKTGRRLQLDQREWVLSKQLIRSGTSIGANIEEAHIPACQELVRLLSSITLTIHENLETTSRARRVDRHNSTFHIPNSTLKP